MAKKPPLPLPPADDGSDEAPASVSGPSSYESVVDITDYEEAAAARRQQAFDESRELVWNGEPLHLFTRERESLLARIIHLDFPGPDLDDLSYYDAYREALIARKPEASKVSLAEIVDFNLYLPTAGKLLFLCAHDPSVLDKLRATPGPLIRKIEEWTFANIAPHQVEEACWLAQRIRYAHRSAMAIQRPTKYSGKAGDSGN